jgi:hypothetical protein
MGSIVKHAQKAGNFKDRELFMRTTGSLPDKKGAAVHVTFNNPNSIGEGMSRASGSGLLSMDDEVVEMTKQLEAPSSNVLFMQKPAGDVVDV